MAENRTVYSTRQRVDCEKEFLIATSIFPLSNKTIAGRLHCRSDWQQSGVKVVSVWKQCGERCTGLLKFKSRWSMEKNGSANCYRFFEAEIQNLYSHTDMFNTIKETKPGNIRLNFQGMKPTFKPNCPVLANTTTGEKKNGATYYYHFHNWFFVPRLQTHTHGRIFKSDHAQNIGNKTKEQSPQFKSNGR